MADSNRCRRQDAECDDSEDAHIVHNAYIDTIQAQPYIWAAMHQGGNIHRYNGRAV